MFRTVWQRFHGLLRHRTICCAGVWQVFGVGWVLFRGVLLTKAYDFFGGLGIFRSSAFHGLTSLRLGILPLKCGDINAQDAQPQPAASKLYRQVEYSGGRVQELALFLVVEALESSGCQTTIAPRPKL